MAVSGAERQRQYIERKRARMAAGLPSETKPALLERIAVLERENASLRGQNEHLTFMGEFYKEEAERHGADFSPDPNHVPPKMTFRICGKEYVMKDGEFIPKPDPWDLLRAGTH
ncbi:hypothetical protein KBI52_10930 [Microvirga sp. HBU67558]|uniref:hypothetical protein n=1 Tax=Microvirga sp. HBU67558 TaxID=2824562 RepID=UPI001B36E274|nr:hypothetical protein [Microvirga sp. HBU67558]MBQ0820719.1 hypothetical protein [Microvirga sp. HBU67558]